MSNRERLRAILSEVDRFGLENRVLRRDRMRVASDVRVWFRRAVRAGIAPEEVCLGATSDGEGSIFVVVGDAASVSESCQARLESGHAVRH